MGLVDYSDSESSGTEAKVPSKRGLRSKAGGGFVPVIDKSGKIKVNLAGSATGQPTSSEEPPEKRARTTSVAGGNSGGGKFAGFNSFLPPPKNTAARPGAMGGGGSSSSSRANAKSTPGFGLRTSAAPGFSRSAADVDYKSNNDDDDDGDGNEMPPKSSGLNLPPPSNAAAGPSIPESQKPASQVKLTGKPLMFRPLSVASGKKKKTTAAATTATASPKPKSPPAPSAPAPEPPKKKAPLFPMPTESSRPAPGPSLSNSATGGAYQPLFDEADYNSASDYAGAGVAAQDVATTDSAPSFESVGDIANDMNLSAAARRELFGRAGRGGEADGLAARRVVNFNMDHEYQHNEALRASGEQQMHNPVRSIQGSGKHSLRQLVSRVQGQKDALEDSFVKGRSNRKDASSRYGW